MATEGDPGCRRLLIDAGDFVPTALDLYLPEAPYQAFIADETRQAKEILTELGLATQ